jgi:hypothetical protein
MLMRADTPGRDYERTSAVEAQSRERTDKGSWSRRTQPVKTSAVGSAEQREQRELTHAQGEQTLQEHPERTSDVAAQTEN